MGRAGMMLVRFSKRYTIIFAYAKILFSSRRDNARLRGALLENLLLWARVRASHALIFPAGKISPDEKFMCRIFHTRIRDSFAIGTCGLFIDTTFQNRTPRTC